MQLVERHIINQNSESYPECNRVCFLSKNLYNYANYIVRQEFIKSSKEKEEGLVNHANYLNYYIINKTLISENQTDYISLPRKVSNQTLMLLDKNWKSFFASIKDLLLFTSLTYFKHFLSNNIKNTRYFITPIYILLLSFSKA